jgi:hypothetical protein
MTTSPKYPKPDEMEMEALYDAGWDLRDAGETAVPISDDPEKWIWWLRRYEGFGEVELEVKRTHTYTTIIGYKD